MKMMGSQNLTKIPKTTLFLILILFLAGFFRLWQLENIPPALFPDEAINANQAIFESGKVFYPENHGREGLFINLVSLSFSLLGISIWAFKFVPALIGILTVFGLYLLSKELFSIERNESNSRYIALLSSFFLAISFWHTNFSRIGFRGILVPFVLVFAFYFLFKGFSYFKLKQTYRPVYRSVFYLILAGIFWGIGFYTYISFRMAILILAIILGIEMLKYWPKFREKLKKNLKIKQLIKEVYLKDGWWQWDVFLATIILITLPLGIYFYQHPEDFFSRAAPISIFKAENPVKEFFKSLFLHLGMFNFYGDPNWRHNFAGSPQLLWPIGIFFLIGLVFSLKKLIISAKNKNCSLFIVHCFLLSWLFIMLLPGILTWEGIPHSLRTIGTIPVVYIFAGLGAFLTINFLNQKFRNLKIKKSLKILCWHLPLFLFCLALIFAQFNKYFELWAKKPEVSQAFNKRFTEIGYLLNSFDKKIKKYVITNAGELPAQVPLFLQMTKNRKEAIYLSPQELNKIKPQTPKTIIIGMAEEKNLFPQLYSLFPQLKIKKINDILIYEISK